MSYMRLVLVGRLGRNPAMSDKREDMCMFSLAVSVGYGEREKTQWFEVAATGRLLDEALRLEKGQQVLVKADMIRVETWRDKDGNPRATLHVRAVGIDSLQNAFAGAGSGYRDSDDVWGDL